MHLRTTKINKLLKTFGLLPLSAILIAGPVFADNIDKIVQDALRHGARGFTYQQMRSFAEAGAHYEPRDNSWTTEKTYHPMSAILAHARQQNQWVYFRDSGFARFLDANGELHIMPYDLMRTLTTKSGMPVFKHGRHVTQAQLLNGQWGNSIISSLAIPKF